MTQLDLDPQNVRRLVIFRLGSIGDTVVALPCFKFLATRFENAERVLLTNRPRQGEAPVASVLDGTGLIDRAIPYDAGERGPLKLFSLFRQLRAERADLLVYLSEAGSTARAARDLFFFRLAGLSVAVGAPITDDLVHARVDQSTGLVEHEADRLARCLQPLGEVDTSDPAGRSLDLRDDECAEAAALLEPISAASGFLAVAASAKVAAKDWGAANWMDLIGRLGETHGDLALVMIGGAGEHARAQAVLAVWPGPVLDLSGRANPRVSAAVMARARLFLGTDGGPMHLAASTGTRCLALFSGYNEPGRWYPMGPGHQILRENVMTEIEPSRVASAARAML